MLNVMLYSTILLHGETSSGTYAAAWILYLQSFPRNTTHSRRKLGRFSFFSFMMSRYESKHFLLECPVTAEISFQSIISTLVQLSDESFAGHMACHSFVVLFIIFSFDNELHDLANLLLHTSFVLSTKCWTLACS